jgi:hypothetical protein
MGSCLTSTRSPTMPAPATARTRTVMPSLTHTTPSALSSPLLSSPLPSVPTASRLWHARTHSLSLSCYISTSLSILPSARPKPHLFLPAAAHQELQEKSDEDSTSAPPAVKKGIDHVSKALEDVQKAEQSMKSHEGGQHQSHMSPGKKEAMIKKMQALQAQIAGDFKHVTTFGNKAGYLPPVKVPHV